MQSAFDRGHLFHGTLIFHRLTFSIVQRKGQAIIIEAFATDRKLRHGVSMERQPDHVLTPNSAIYFQLWNLHLYGPPLPPSSFPSRVSVRSHLDSKTEEGNREGKMRGGGGIGVGVGGVLVENHNRGNGRFRPRKNERLEAVEIAIPR